MSMSTPGPGAHEMQRDLIVQWHARGQDALDTYGVPRFADGIEYTIAERVDLLAEAGGVAKQPPRDPGWTRPEQPPPDSLGGQPPNEP